MEQTSFIYLHGFASGPQSLKASYLRERFASLGIDLKIPDLNQGGFFHLTITRQLQQVEAELESGEAVTLIGSSLGGLVAAWLGQRNLQVQRLVLLAPAFQFLHHWLAQLKEQSKRWQTEKSMLVYHYGEQKYLPLGYEFVVDAAQYQDTKLLRPIPTLILHGKHDEVIPFQASSDFASKRPWVKLVALESDHALGNVLPQVWQAIREFCRINLE